MKNRSQTDLRVTTAAFGALVCCLAAVMSGCALTNALQGSSAAGDAAGSRDGGAVADASGCPAPCPDAPPANGSPDAGARCDPTAAFGAPVPVASLGNSDETDPALSPDELTIYFAAKMGGASGFNLYVAERSAIGQPFGAPTALAGVNSAANDDHPTVSSDRLTLLFQSDRGGIHIYVSTRASALAAFGAPAEAPGVNSTAGISDGHPFLTADGQALWFISDRAGSSGQYDIYRAARSGAGFANPQPVPALNSTYHEFDPTLSADSLTIYFASDRPGGKGGFDIWTAHRGSTADVFPTPVPVPEVSTAGNDEASWLSADNCRLYLDSDVSGKYEIYVATRKPGP